MKPCKVRQTDSGAMLCLCHGQKAKWKDGYFCIAQPVKADWVEVQRQQISKGGGTE